MSSWYQPSTVTTVADPIDSDDTCPGCGAAHGVQPQPAPPTVAAWTCTACGLDWAVTVVNPTLRVALSSVGLLPTPQLRTAALLDVLHTKVPPNAQGRNTPRPLKPGRLSVEPHPPVLRSRRPAGSKSGRPGS